MGSPRSSLNNVEVGLPQLTARPVEEHSLDFILKDGGVGYTLFVEHVKSGAMLVYRLLACLV